jgi:hypothetical protein
MMRRVRKEEVQRETWTKPDGLVHCLECWKSWMLSDDRDLSASRMRLHAGDAQDGTSGGYDSNPYDEQRKADYKVGEATGAMIEDMKPAWRWALYKKCGITTQWKFPLLDFMVVLIDAQADLEKKLRNNIATATFF